MIGGFESTWFAGLVAAYLMTESIELFIPTLYQEIYRDDGLVVTSTKWSKRQIDDWLILFQARVNKIAGNDYVKFTIKAWSDDLQKFPFWDMDLYWLGKGELRFKIHLKPNQELKYLIKGSMHPKSCLAAIPRGLMKRMASLTSATKDTLDVEVDQLYLKHAKALEWAGIAPREYPTLRKIIKLDKDLEEEEIKAKEQQLQEKQRQQGQPRIQQGLQQQQGN